MKDTIAVILIAIAAILPFLTNLCESQTRPPRTQQKAEAYTLPDCHGPAILLSQHGHDILPPSLANKIRSVRSVGIWLFYVKRDFEGEMEFDFQPTEDCFNLIDIGGQSSSVRPAGNYFNVFDDFLYLYDRDWFRGRQYAVVLPQASLVIAFPNSPKSIIITGDKPWELFEEENFQGNSVCVGLEDFNPSFICDASEVFPFHIRSVRAGCGAGVTVNRTNCNTRYDDIGGRSKAWSALPLFGVGSMAQLYLTLIAVAGAVFCPKITVILSLLIYFSVAQGQGQGISH